MSIIYVLFTSNLGCNEGPLLVDEVKLLDGFVHTEPPDKLGNVPHLLVRVLHVVPHVTHIGRPVLPVWLPHSLIVRGPVKESPCALNLRLLVPFAKPEQNIQTELQLELFHH